jgi:hypothetical protein
MGGPNSCCGPRKPPRYFHRNCIYTRLLLKGYYLECCVCRLALPVEPKAAGIGATDTAASFPYRHIEAQANTYTGTKSSKSKRGSTSSFLFCFLHGNFLTSSFSFSPFKFSSGTGSNFPGFLHVDLHLGSCIATCIYA